jgi:isoquinoline 1-oxidoreductase alpha subunit
MINLKINGKEHNLDVEADVPLVWVLRDYLGLNAAKFGCGIAVCGACTVHVDNKPVRSCVVPVGSLKNKQITTLEGVDSDIAAKIKKSWLDLQVPQCGYCQSGQIMSVITLLETNPNPDDADIDDAMSGNLCRCGTYLKIREAIHVAAKSI